MAKTNPVTFPLFYGQGDTKLSVTDYITARYGLPEEETVEAEHTVEHPDAVSVKVSFNRPFTWSEREAFRKFINKKNREHEWTSDSSVVIWDFDLDPHDESTRKVTKEVAAFVATAYLNVHPRSAKSLYPEVIV